VSRRPLFHILAGPNGAGKSTLYRTKIAPRFPDAEFVNADELAAAHYGHPALTLEESQTGQRLAEERRRALMAQGKSLVTESTFSHPSKIDLIRNAITAGYDVRLYHVNVCSADLSVKRVDRRVTQGGHPVPEDKIRERYTRNQALILQAARLVDRAHVFDNSAFGQPPELVLTLDNGTASYASDTMPAWARTLYAEELTRYSPERLNRPAASLASGEQ
jgi:predicted ABC-type ATPase